jgi:hypothetical protein
MHTITERAKGQEVMIAGPENDLGVNKMWYAYTGSKSVDLFRHCNVERGARVWMCVVGRKESGSRQPAPNLRAVGVISDLSVTELPGFLVSGARRAVVSSASPFPALCAMTRLSLLCFALLWLFPTLATAHIIHVAASKKECFFEDLHRNDKVLAVRLRVAVPTRIMSLYQMTVTYQVGGGGHLDIDFWVRISKSVKGVRLAHQ